jgi:putative cofactor-binding repeat protein
MRNRYFFLLVGCLALSTARAQTTRTLLLDFGPNDVTNGNITPSPDANGNYWNNVLNQTATPLPLVDKANAATGISVSVGANFLTNGLTTGGLLAPSAALLGQYAIATATQDFFFVQGTGSTASATLTFSGLASNRRYVFHVFGSRVTNSETRVSQYDFAGTTTSTKTLTTTGPGIGSGGYDGNNNKLAHSDTLSANASGVITMTLSKAAGQYAYINLIGIDIVPQGTGPAVNYSFQNPGFELGNLNFWTTTPSGSGASAAVSTTVDHTGTYAARLSGGSLALEQQIAYAPVTGTTQHLLGGYFYHSNSGGLQGSQTARLELRYYNSAQTLLARYRSDSLTATSGINAWIRLKAISPSIPAGAAYVKAVVVWRNPAGATGSVYFDDLMLETYTPPTLDPLKIVFMGSSVPFGIGATNNHGYTSDYSDLLGSRFSAGQGANWTTANICIPGNNTLSVMNRYDTDLIPQRGKYVVFALVLGNEGIQSGGQAIYDQFRTNMQQLIRQARLDGMTPVITNCYGRNDYNATDYAFVKQLDLLINTWNVPSVNLLGAADDGNGSGHWVDGYWWDALHPNDLGHTELFHAVVPSLFDALNANKPMPKRKASTGVKITAASARIIRLVPEDVVHPFTNAIRFKTNAVGRIVEIRDSAGLAAGTLRVNGSGTVTYTSAKGNVITGTRVVNNDRWHKLVLTHFYARGTTHMYVDSVLEGTVAERLRPTRFDIGGSSAPTRIQYRDWFFFRSGMNQGEILRMAADSMMKSSLEIYAPLDGSRVVSADSVVNLAQSTNTLSIVAGTTTQLDGTYYVGTGTSPNASRTYTTLPAAISALTTVGVAPNASVRFELLDATYSLGTTALAIPGVTLSAGQTITIAPYGSVTPLITGSSTTALLILDGTDYLTISGYNGSTSARTITLRNTASAPAVLLRNEATNNTLRNLNLESANGTTGTVTFGTVTSGSVGNSSNTITSCDVRALSVSPNTVPAYGIFSLGSATGPNRTNTVQSCNVSDFTAGGIYLNDTGNGGAWTVSGNNIYQTASRTGAIRGIRLTGGDNDVVTNNSVYQQAGTLGSTFYGIAVVSGNGHTISGNFIGGAAADATGTPMTVSGVGATFYGMYLSLGTTTPTSVQGNTIRAVASTVAGTTYGVQLVAGAISFGTVTPNSIGSTTTGLGITATNALTGLAVDTGNPTATVGTNTFAGLTATTGALNGILFAGTGASSVNGVTMNGLTSTAAVSGVAATGTGVISVGNSAANAFSNLSSTGANTVAGVLFSGSSNSSVNQTTIKGLTSAGGSVYGVLVSSTTATVAIGTTAGNVIGGSGTGEGLSSTAGTVAGVALPGTGAASAIANNTISYVSQSGTSTNLYGIFSNFATGSSVTGNTVSNVTYAGSSTGQTVYGIYAGGNNTVSGNTISTVRITVGGNNNLRGIYVGGSAGATPTVTDNIVSGITTAATGSVSTAGIYVGSATGGAVLGITAIQRNRISNVGTTNSASTTSTHVISGLLCGAVASGSVTERNRIWNVYGSTAGTGASADQVRGLAVQGVYAGTFANNQISMAPGTLTQQTYGIQDLSTSGTTIYYYNSVYLAPATSGAGTSYAFYRSAAASAPTVTLRNNLFYNARTAGSGAVAYALGTATTTGWTATSSNYNLLVNSAAATVGKWGASNLSFANWKAAPANGGSGGDASSLSETSAALPAASLFTDVTTATSNLDINATNSAAWYANGNGVQLAGQSADYGSATAARATTVAGGGSDLGADEFIPTAAPPALMVSGAPALGGTQTFTLGGRPIATLTFGNTGTVPTSTTGRYYSGTNPTVFAATTRYTNYFTEITATGGSGYTYTVVLFYDDALLGSVAAESAQHLLKRNTNGTYTFFPASTTDATANTLTATGLTSFSQFFGTDVAAPLPVTLTTFTAVRAGAAVKLDWGTANERNSAGFEVQVSTNGREFQTLAFVPSATPNSTVPQAYHYLDATNGKTGTRYYRLKQVDLDGQYALSAVRTVSFDAVGQPLSVTGTPNPFTTELTLTLTLPEATPAVRLAICDAVGRQVLAQELALPAGTSHLQLPQELAALPAGVYVVQVTAAGSTHRVKLLKVKE